MSTEVKSCPYKVRKPSPFLVFCKEVRPLVKKQNPTTSFGEIGKILGAKWNELSPEERGGYEADDLTPEEEQAIIDARAAKVAAKAAVQARKAANIAKKEKSDAEKAVKALKADKKADKKAKSLRVPSPYILFCQDVRPSVTQQNPNATFGEKSKMFGVMWAALSPEDKDVYVQRSAKLLIELKHKLDILC